MFPENWSTLSFSALLNEMVNQIQWKRVLRLSIAALVFLFILLNLTLAWWYVDRLVRPGCAVPAPLEIERKPDVLALETADGWTLEAWYYPPQNGAVVIAAGGSLGSLGKQFPPAAFLIREGYGVMQISGRNCAGALVTLGGDEVLDIAAAVDWLEAQPEVGHIGVMGFSMGGAAAIRAAAMDQRIERVVAEGGFFNLGDDFVEPGSGSWLDKPLLYSIAGIFRLRTGLDPWRISPVDDIGKISPRHVFLIFGEHEQVSGRAMQQFNAAGEPKSLWIVPGGHHGTNYRTAPADYERRVLEFFSEWWPAGP